MSDSRIILSRFSLLQGSLRDTTVEFWQDPDLQRIFPRYLMMLHTAIRASVLLMEEASKIAAGQFASESYSSALVAYLDEHIEEERDHDIWLLEDLATLGVTEAEAALVMPLSVVASMVGSQYYYIKHVNPAIILGYLAAIEGYQLDSGLLDKARERTGYPESAFRTLYLHSELDQDHAGELAEAIDGMGLPHDLIAKISANGLQTLGRALELTRLLERQEVDSLLPSETLAASVS